MAQPKRKFLDPESHQRFRSAPPVSTSARELIRRGRRGVGVAGFPATQSRTQVRTRLAQSRTQVRTRLWIAARRSARKSARGHAGPHAGLGGAMGDSLELPGQARLSPTQAVEADRMWKAPGHRPPAPGPSHNRWKSRPPSTAPGFPQLRTASATRSQGEEEEEENRKSTLLYTSSPGARGTIPSRPPARVPAAVG
jgi:hypothetical protein